MDQRQDKAAPLCSWKWHTLVKLRHRLRVLTTSITICPALTSCSGELLGLGDGISMLVAVLCALSTFTTCVGLQLFASWAMSLVRGQWQKVFGNNEAK